MARTTGLEPATPPLALEAENGLGDPEKADSGPSAKEVEEATVRPTVRFGSFPAPDAGPDLSGLDSDARRAGGGTEGASIASDADLTRLAARWPALPVEVRRALLVLAGIPQEPAL
jgi:hypothetical protein